MRWNNNKIMDDLGNNIMYYNILKVWDVIKVVIEINLEL